MTTSPEERRPLSSNFRLSVDAPPSAPPWATQTNNPTPVDSPVEGLRESTTTRLRRAWSTTGDGDGGAVLDQALTELGQSYAQGGRVVWQAPPDLDPEYVDYLSASVEQLNSLIEAGVMEVAEDGSIRPVIRSAENERSSSEA